MIATADNIHVTLPAEAFYFATVKWPKRGRPHLQQVLFVIEPYLPVPLEDIHACIAFATDGSIVVCALPRELLQTCPANAQSISPASVPTFLDGMVEADEFNLLTGPFEPRRVRRVRWASTLAAYLAVAIMTALTVVGFSRRTSALHEARGTHDSAIRDVAKRINMPPTSSAQQLFLQLTAELRGLRQTRSAGVIDPELFDASAALAELLSRWPNDLVARTDALNITRSQITVRAEVTLSSDVQQLADALSTLPGWTVQQPRVNSTRDGASCTITLLPKEARP